MKSLLCTDNHAMLLKAFLLVALLLQVFSRSGASLQLDSVYLAEIRQGIHLTIVERFSEARMVFEKMVERDSTDHAAYLFLAGVIHAEMLDREDYQNKPEFDRLVKKAISCADGAIAKGGSPAWAHLTKGNAYAYVAVMEAKVGSWWGALRKGLAAKNEYLKALELDPGLYDAYLGLGSYHYWKSARTEFINWLPLVPDRKDEGLKELQLAVDSSLFSNDLALNSLVWICLHKNEASKAYEIASRLHQKYPDSRLMLWGLAFSSYLSGQLRRAADYFGEILAQIENQPGQNHFNTIECRYHRARIYRTLHEDKKASSELETLLNYPASEEIKDRQKAKLEKGREILTETKASD